MIVWFVVACIAVLWTAPALMYRWIHGVHLKWYWWPFANGAVLRGRRVPRWEVGQ